MKGVTACEIGVSIVAVVADLRDESLNGFMVEDAAEAYGNARFIAVEDWIEVEGQRSFVARAERYVNQIRIVIFVLERFHSNSGSANG